MGICQKLRIGLCKQLLNIGIPEEKHNLESLTEMFPASMRMHISHLEPDSMAEVLIYLINKKIVK